VDRIAIISDIHGNIPALETVLADIQARGIETIYCLGDLVGKGPQSALAVDICRARCEIVIRGNWDDFIGSATGNPTLRWHQQQLGPERLDYLRQLPNTIDLTMSGRRIRLFHASQTSVHVRVLPGRSLEPLLAMFSNTPFTGYDLAEPDVVGYGDIHAAYLLSLPHGHRTLFNVGSVGNPLDEPTAAYAILEGLLNSDQKAPFTIQLVRLPYDIERAIDLAASLDMPALEPYAAELRTSVYRGRQ
jgi:protein phosphatase